MSFLDFFKGKKSNGDRASLVINDQFLEVLQLRKSGGQMHLMSFNRAVLPAGVVENGMIVNESAFQKALLQLAESAKPQPLSTQKMTVAVPFGQLFSFIKKGNSRSDAEASKKLLTEEIRKESPVSPEEMSLQFYSDSQGHKFTYGAIAWLRSWESAVREALGEIGVQSIEFIPEPLAQWAIAESPSAGNFALGSWQDDKLFLSLFYHNLLYDSFLLECRGKTLNEGLEAYFDQFSEEAKAYLEVWSTPLQTFYLINAPEAARPVIDAMAKKEGLSHSYLDEYKTSLAGQLEAQKYSATLMGLALLAFKE
jgi:hypothetical protein